MRCEHGKASDGAELLAVEEKRKTQDAIDSGPDATYEISVEKAAIDQARSSTPRRDEWRDWQYPQGRARLFLAQMPADAPLPTVVWANLQQQGQQVTWGQWPCHTFTHCVTVMTERHARTLHELDDEPLPPVVDCALAGVARLCSSCHGAAGVQMRGNSSDLSRAKRGCALRWSL